MPAPKDLRANAWSKIKSARALCAVGQYDNASYLAGYAVELALKARYCTRTGLARFPDDKEEAKQLGLLGAFTHILPRLLTLSDSQSIQQSSLHNIDWVRAMDWDSEQRYDLVGSVTKEQAEAQVQETEKLFVELALFEIVELLWKIEQEVSAENGPFCLFIIAYNATQQNGWEVVMSAWWLKSREALIKIHDKAAAILDDDLRATLVKWTAFHPADTLIQRYNQMMVVHQRPIITSHNAEVGRIMPPAFVITSRRIQEPTNESSSS